LVEATKAIEDVLQKTVNNSWSEAGTLIIDKVNKHLSAFVRQDYIAKLDPNTFEIKLHDSHNAAVAASDGQSLLLSLTFISALISFSRDRRNAKGQILTPGAVAPFVIDAPFGVLDNTYKGRIAEAIPKSVDQVIFLLSSSHWAGQVEQGIRDKVGSEYNMVLEDTSKGDGKGVDHIEIEGQKYDTVRYNCQVEQTLIEKVGDYV
jgi:DNA sulfur modification protein DndD